MSSMCGGGGGRETTVTQTGPAAQAQGNILGALAPFITRGWQNVAYGTLPTADRIAALSRLSPAEENLPAYLRANYDPFIGALGTGASQLFAGAQAPIGRAEGRLADAGQFGAAQARSLSPAGALAALSPSLLAAPGQAAAPLQFSFGEGPGQVGLLGLAQAAQGMNAPLDTNAILAPLERSFRETVAPEIRSAAMRAGVPGGSGEQDLFTRAAGRYGTQAGEALSNAELARRGVGLQGLGQASGNIQQWINAQLARRQLGLSGLQTATSGALGTGQLSLGYGGQAINAAEIENRQELEKRGLGIQAILGAGGLAGQAAQAGAIAPERAANIGALNRTLGIQAAGMPWQMTLAALGAAPNPLQAATGTTTTSPGPSMGAEIGGGIGSAFLLQALLRNMFGGR